MCLAMTTNERMNSSRYSHFHSEGLKGNSPFDRGLWQNVVDFAGWRFAGFCRPIRDDWMNKFELDSNIINEDGDSDKAPLLHIV